MGFSGSGVRKIARFIVPAFAGQLLVQRDGQPDRRCILTTSPANVIALQVLAGWPFGFTIPAEAGIIELD